MYLIGDGNFATHSPETRSNSLDAKQDQRLFHLWQGKEVW